VWRTCVVEPVFVPDEEWVEGSDKLPMKWVDPSDMQYLFDWAQGVDETVEAWFRRRQIADLQYRGERGEVREDSGGVVSDRPDEEPVVDTSVQ